MRARMKGGLLWEFFQLQYHVLWPEKCPIPSLSKGFITSFMAFTDATIVVKLCHIWIDFNCRARDCSFTMIWIFPFSNIFRVLYLPISQPFDKFDKSNSRRHPQGPKSSNKNFCWLNRVPLTRNLGLYSRDSEFTSRPTSKRSMLKIRLYLDRYMSMLTIKNIVGFFGTDPRWP